MGRIFLFSLFGFILFNILSSASSTQFIDFDFNQVNSSVTNGRKLLKRQAIFTFHEQWLDQPLDHFDRANSQTWKQRYWANFHYFGKKSHLPIFVWLNGEAEAEDYFLTHGTMAKNAAKFRAVTVVLEHRYYGKSRPTR